MSNKMSAFDSLPPADKLGNSGAAQEAVRTKLDEIANKILGTGQKHGFTTVECGIEDTIEVCRQLRKKNYSVVVRSEFGDKYFYEIQWSGRCSNGTNGDIWETR